MPGFPAKPSFRPIVGEDGRRGAFGKFEYVPEPLVDNRENIRILGSWEHDNVVRVPIPQLRKILGPSAPEVMRFHKIGATQLQRLWEEWEREDVLKHVLSYAGAFVPRFQRGSTTALSNHAYASAFDINAPQNPLRSTPAAVGKQGCVRELVPIAHKWGFYWGGHFEDRPDGMHFELAEIKDA